MRNFHTLLLSRRSSPIAILDALFRRDALTRLYFRRYHSTDADVFASSGKCIPRDDAEVRFVAMFLLLLLIVAAPIVNVFAVGLTLESESTLSFQDAGFGGLFLGVYKDAQGDMTDVLKRERVTEDCEKFEVEQLSFDVITARVTMCAQTLRPGDTGGLQEARISVLIVEEVRILVQVSIGSQYWERYYSGYLRTGKGENFLLKAAVDKEHGGLLAKEGIKVISKFCRSGSTREEAEFVPKEAVEADRKYVVGRMVQCEIEVEKEKEGKNAVFGLVNRIMTVVPTDDMVVKKPSGKKEDAEEFFSAKDKEFLRRRTRLVGLSVLAILAGVIVIARMIVGCVLNNDISEGLERVVKERLGLQFCDSMLQDVHRRTIVQYSIEDSEARNSR